MATYKKREEIGGGGFGVVYRAVRDDDAEFALKELRTPFPEEARQRFVREIRLQSNLSHTNVMPIVGMNTDWEPPFFVMPLASSSLIPK